MLCFLISAQNIDYGHSFLFIICSSVSFFTPWNCFANSMVVVVSGFYISPTAKVTRRPDLGLKSHSKDFANSVLETRKNMLHSFCVFKLYKAFVE